ncbi:hypothetical protein NESM_000237900 [Novymonas esmeraldas]|uniref:Secreted protein n=1 Tax=Novymonas esmeraldas TaxID=1808958 RepID=A0AAW0F9W0_9TRYP
MGALLRALLLLLCIAASVLVQGSTARGPPPQAPRPFETKFKSLSQACWGVLETECPHDGATRTDCLMQHYAGNDNHECKMWLAWRATCFAYATVKLIPTGKCGFTAEEATTPLIRQCLRTADKTKIPGACSASPYFKSLMLRAPRRMDSDTTTADL